MTPRPRAAAALAALAVAGCATRRHRYVDLAVAREEAQAAARASAAAQGICPLERGRSMVVLVKQGRHDGPPWAPLACDKLSPEEQAAGRVKGIAKDPRSGVPLYAPLLIGMAAHERPGGTRLLLSGDPEAPLERILPDAPAHEYRVQVSMGRQKTLVFEPALDVGVTSAGGRTFAEGELGFLIGARVWRHGGGVLAPAPEHGISVLANLGLVVELQRDVRAIPDDEITRRVGVAVQYDRVKTVSPIPGAHLKQGTRALVRLTFDAVLGKRDGFEIGLSGQPIDWVGGLYARAGYQFGPDAGPTYSAGVELGQAPITGVALIPVAIGLVYLLAHAAARRTDPEALPLAP